MKITEQELNILLLSNDTDALDYFYRSSSSSVDGRRSKTLFTDDPKKGFIIEMPNKNSKSVDMINAYFKAMGYALDIEYGKDSTDTETFNVECEVPDIPDYLSNLFNNVKEK